MTDCPQHSDSINLVELFFCFYRTKSPILPSQIFVPDSLTPWNAPSVPDLRTAHRWSYWHAMVASGPVTFSTILSKKRLQVSLTPTGRTLGCLSSAVIREYINPQSTWKKVPYPKGIQNNWVSHKSNQYFCTTSNKGITKHNIYKNYTKTIIKSKGFIRASFIYKYSDFHWESFLNIVTRVWDPYFPLFPD